MKILDDNPYRILGVYSNSPTRERLANSKRMAAFLKVGKHVSFPLDLPQYFSPTDRTESSVSAAEAKLTLPKDQVRYAQFWFMKATPMDDVAFNHLAAGDIGKAEDIWGKKECASSLQNLIVCALIRVNYEACLKYAECLYGNASYTREFVSAVIGEEGHATPEELTHEFLDSLADAIGTSGLLVNTMNSEWKRYICEKSTKPLIDDIEAAIETARNSKGKGAEARLNAGNTLRDSTKSTLAQLGELLQPSDMLYQMIADKLGLEILQCGIDYYNDSDEPDAALKAMNLQGYADSIVVGQMAKDRCKENVNILRKIIDNLPPKEVYAEDKAIKEELHKYCQLPDKICHAVTLLNNTKPHLLSIKQKLGATNAYYLNISTQVAGNALHNVIEEVNQALKYDPAEERRKEEEQQRKKLEKLRNSENPLDRTFAEFLYTHPLSLLYTDDRKEKYEHIKRIVLEAREVLLLIDSLDMEAEFVSTRYLPNRDPINKMLTQFGSSLPQYKPVSIIKETKSGVQNTKKENTSDNGCTTSWIVLIVVCMILGAIIGGWTGFFLGGFVGFMIGLQIDDFVNGK